MDFPMMPTPIKLIFFTLFSSLSALCFYIPESEYNSAKHPRTDAIFILPAFLYSSLSFSIKSMVFINLLFKTVCSAFKFFIKV